MTIRDILFPMLSYPTATAADSIERAIAWATGLGAHFMGVTFELDSRSPVGLYAHPVHISGFSRLNAEKVPRMHATSSPPSKTFAHVKVQRAPVPRMSTRSNTVRRAR